jgi:nucleotide-binding universal stress UspA family protein
MTAPAPAPSRIVVGVDGSEQSKLALRWAAYVARLGSATVDAVMAWDYPVTFGWSAGWSYPDGGWTPQEDAEKALAEALAEVYGEQPPAGLRRFVEQGNAAKVLLDHSDGATLLVVGSRGHGGFAGLLLGSVSANCAEHAPCPVLVVHGNEPPPA